MAAGSFSRAFASNSPHLERCYPYFVAHAEEMLAQRSGLQPFPWEQALESLLARIEDQNLDWWLVGSTVLAVRGISGAPGDLDLPTRDVDARNVDQALSK